MRGGEGRTNEIDALLDELFGERPSNASPALARTAKLLASGARAAARARIARRLGSVTAFSAETAVRAACVMSMSGISAHRVAHFLARCLPGTVTLPQFETAVRFIFDDQPPVPPGVLHDLTEHPYLDRRILVRRSVEIAAQLQESLTPPLLLFLFLLSLRDDLSNENLHLVVLILRLCFPKLKARGRSRGMSAAEERDVAEAWKDAQRRLRSRGVGQSVPDGRVAADPAAGESASFFLDKYFSDAHSPGSPTAGFDREKQEAASQPASRLVFVRTSGRGGSPRRAAVAGRKSARRLRAPSPARLRSAPRLRETKPPSGGPRPSRPTSHGTQAPDRALRRRILVLMPLGLAAVLVVALTLVSGVWNKPKKPVMRPHDMPSQVPAATPREQAAPAQEHIVQSGDSLWKLYGLARANGAFAGRWEDFLRLMKERNDLPDPDRIYPGDRLQVTDAKP